MAATATTKMAAMANWLVAVAAEERGADERHHNEDDGDDHGGGAAYDCAAGAFAPSLPEEGGFQAARGGEGGVRRRQTSPGRNAKGDLGRGRGWGRLKD